MFMIDIYCSSLISELIGSDNLYTYILSSSSLKLEIKAYPITD